MKPERFKPGYYDNAFPLVGLHAVQGVYRLVEFDGVPEADEDADKHVGRLAGSLRRALKAPVAVVTQNGQRVLAVGSGGNIPKDFAVPPYSISLRPASGPQPLSFIGTEGRERDIALEFLRRVIRDLLNRHPDLWQDGSRYVQRMPEPWAGSDRGVDRYPAFWLGIVPSDGGGFSVSFDRTYAYLEGLPLSRALPKDQLNALSGCRCLYRYGMEWYRVAVKGPGRSLGSYNIPDLDNPKGLPITLLAYIQRRWQGHAIHEIAALKPEDLALFYREDKGAMRGAATPLLHRILGTDHSVVRELHRYAVLRPDIRLREVLAIRDQYLPSFELFGVTVKTGSRPDPVKVAELPVPGIRFGQEAKCRHVGSKRWEMLADPKIGPLTRTPFDPQYALLPDSLPAAVRDDFLRRVRDVLSEIYPQPYAPEVLIYQSGARKLRDQISAMEAKLEGRHGGLLQVLPRHAARDLHDHLKRLQWKRLQSQCAREEKILGFYESHNGTFPVKPDREARYRGYLHGLALGVLAVNRKWLWRLEDGTLNAEAYLGIDVYKGTAAFTSVYRDGREIFFRVSPSAAEERLSRDQVQTEVTKILTQDLRDLGIAPQSVVIHRDGRLLIPERQGLEDARRSLIRVGIVPPSFQFVVAEVHKSSTYRPRFFRVADYVGNPQMGIWRQVSSAEAILATTGHPLLSQGTARPLHLKVVMETMPIGQVVSDFYGLSHLGFTAPAACHRLAITMALADEVLRGMTPGDPEGDVWEEEVDEPSEAVPVNAGGAL